MLLPGVPSEHPHKLTVITAPQLHGRWRVPLTPKPRFLHGDQAGGTPEILITPGVVAAQTNSSAQAETTPVTFPESTIPVTVRVATILVIVRVATTLETVRVATTLETVRVATTLVIVRVATTLVIVRVTVLAEIIRVVP
jgi:hypothetical protein